MRDTDSADDGATIRERATDLRRGFHRYPEPAWCEFFTTSRLVDELERLDVDELHVGREALDAGLRMGVPDEDELARWRDRAADRGARDDVLDRTEGGVTGVVAVVRKGDGPTVGLRVDIDALRRRESADADHRPVAEGFRSENESAMHACGHDAHMTLGLGALEAVSASEFSGTFKLFCQPAEEVLGGGKAMAAGGHLDDVDHLFAVHVGLGHPTGEVVAGADKPLAVRQLRAEFTGESAHAGLAPNEGRNAMQAMAAAVQNVYGIPRHADGLTRVNVGRAVAGSASNVVAEDAAIELEARAESNKILDYVNERVERTLASAAEMHDCEVETTVMSEAPRVDSDEKLVEVVRETAAATDGVESVVRRADFGASEDATYLMERVKENGGDATYVVVGTDHPTGHHTGTFDVDERSIPIGIDVLAGAVERVGGSGSV